ncbi:MAG: hypothetical protein HYT75_01115 [Deltaproteobacteria bacterium]|nr:hypothetical protein [Deltaproteobacteria bacterium]MBI2341507.1 hypothetical protein [Deltaproteobacteria bacterium]
MNIHLSSVDWQQRPNRREKIIFACSVLIFFAVFLKSCWYPSNKAIGVAKSELKGIIEEKIALERNAGLLQDTDAKGKLWTGTPDERVAYIKMAQRVSESPNVVLMKEFSNPALLRDVKLSNIDFPDQKNESGMIKQQWKINVNGAFVSVGKYIERLEGLPMLLFIDNITFNSANDPFGRVNAEVEGTVYGWK